MEPYVSRPLGEDERRLVADSWLVSFRFKGVYGPLKPGTDEFLKVYSPIVNAILDAPGVKVLVAHHPNVPEIVMGWVCVEERDGEPILHYAFTKKDFRREGIFRFLLGVAGIDGEFTYTFETSFTERLFARDIPRWIPKGADHVFKAINRAREKREIKPVTWGPIKGRVRVFGRFPGTYNPRAVFARNGGKAGVSSRHNGTGQRERANHSARHA